MKETIIISGSEINIEFAKKYLKKAKYEYIIAVDKGLEVLDKLNVIPTHIVGDFDSVNNVLLEKYRNSETEIITFEVQKDYTDTDLGVQIAIGLGNNNITIIGGVGSRIDHTLANIHILNRALNENVKCKLVNEHNEIFLINKEAELKKDEEYNYISLIPLTSKVKINSLEGFKYPLIDYELNIGESIGVSNEQTEETAYIKIDEGILIVIKSKD